MTPFSLKGKTILVTGASSGIGKATAIECSKMGAELIITGRNINRLDATYTALSGEGHTKHIVELTNDKELNNLIKNIQSIDGAVLCAGISDIAPVRFCSLMKFNKVFNTNFFSQTELIRLLLKNKTLSDGGSVVAISSIAAYNHSLGNSIYGSSKAALSSWIKYAAKENGSKGIRFNCICPGMVETPLIHDGAYSEDQMKQDKSNYPLLRYGTPEEIAYGAIYLLSDASKWVTGIDLIIDGGCLL